MKPKLADSVTVNCGLWVLNEIILKIYPENLKKIVEAIWELPAGNFQTAPTIFSNFQDTFFKLFH